SRRVHSAGPPRRGGAGGEGAGRLAHRSADRGASVAGGVGDFCGCGIGRADRLLRAREDVGADVLLWAGGRGSPKWRRRLAGLMAELRLAGQMRTSAPTYSGIA